MLCASSTHLCASDPQGYPEDVRRDVQSRSLGKRESRAVLDGLGRVRAVRACPPTSGILPGTMTPNTTARFDGCIQRLGPRTAASAL